MFQSIPKYFIQRLGAFYILLLIPFIIVDTFIYERFVVAIQSFSLHQLRIYLSTKGLLIITRGIAADSCTDLA